MEELALIATSFEELSLCTEWLNNNVISYRRLVTNPFVQEGDELLLLFLEY